MPNTVKDFERILSAQRVVDRFATEFPSEEALREYLKDHPDADRSKHHVKKTEGKPEAKEDDKANDGKPPEKGPDPKEVSPKEVSSQIEAGWKGLSLGVPTYTGLRGLNKAINSGKATKKDRDDVLEDLDFEHKRVSGKKDPTSKGDAKKIKTLMTLLKSDGVTKMLK